jgi:hypothetical protein
MSSSTDFDKYLAPLTDVQQRRLEELGRLELNEFNEHDVREEFLAPLVEILGYRRGDTYEVRRGESFALSPGFVMIGRQRVELDYKFNIWKQGFWLMEAKPAKCPDPSSPPKLTDEDVGQAFFYALHPQVDAPFFAVILRHRLAVAHDRTGQYPQQWRESDSVTELSLSPSPVHSASSKRP